MTDELQEKTEDEAGGENFPENDKDEDILVAEYVSDDEGVSSVTEEDGDDMDDHVTKVCIFVLFLFLLCGSLLPLH